MLEQVLDNNKETVKIVFKNMPLRFHKMAAPSALAALAADQQGKFWEYHDQLFAVKKLSENEIVKTAQSLGLDMDKFNQDRASNALRAKLQKDMTDAQKAGVTGTPTVFVNGRLLKQRSLAGFQALIDDELQKLAAEKSS
jgi:protein-disulfide isomerase